MARPTVRTPQNEERLMKALQSGNTRKASCAHAGISTDVFNRWMNEDDAFAQRAEQAENEGEVRNVAIISMAAAGHDVVTVVTTERVVPGKIVNGERQPDEVFTETRTTTAREFSWQAAAWWLERRRAEDWKRHEKVDLEAQIEVTTDATAAAAKKLQKWQEQQRQKRRTAQLSSPAVPAT